LTAAKEAGETMDIAGKKIALGVPGAKLAEDDHSHTPLRRGGTPEEAAASILL